MTSLTDIALELGDARDHAARLRAVIHHARRRGISLPATEATLAVTERQIDRLSTLRWVVLAAIDKLAADITHRACCGCPHDREEQHLLEMLGCEEFDAERWPYVAAALRAREEPTAGSVTTFFRARQVLWMRRAA